MNQEERVSVQADPGWFRPGAHLKGLKPPGTITWAEHEAAWKSYSKSCPGHQTVTKVAQRGGFTYEDLERYLGHPPKTWQTAFVLDDEGRYRVPAETRRG